MRGSFNLKSKNVVVIVMIFIAFIAFVFHYPIQIIDGLNSEPVPGFDIRISICRIIFEPVFGPLLFYLRADQPFEEFGVLLIWILSLSLVYLIVYIISNKNNYSFKTILKRSLYWLRNVTLLVCIWFGLLLIIIFGRLPANTIINNHENIILVNTHCHSEHSHDGIISQEGLLKWHAYHGFNAFFITDHGHHEETMKAVKAQGDGALPQNPLIICGEEFSGGNHMTLLGLNRNFNTKGLTDQQVVDSAHQNNGVVIVAHWFDGERKSIPYFLDLGVEGFEIANQGYGLTYEKRIFDNIVNTCTSNGLLTVGAADYHGYGNACFVWNALNIPGWHQMGYDQKRESVLNIFRQKSMSKIQVLLYNDRHVFNRSQVLWSPFYTSISYFRSLSIWQVLSWFIWLSILRYVVMQMSGGKRKAQIRSRHILGIMAFLSSIYMLALGMILISRIPTVSHHNEIYKEYGTILLWGGSCFLVYIIILIIFEIRRIRLERRTENLHT